MVFTEQQLTTLIFFSIQNLSLKSCQLKDEAAIHLADALVDNKTLLTLNLSFNKISDEGAKHIAKVKSSFEFNIVPEIMFNNTICCSLLKMLTNFFWITSFLKYQYFIFLSMTKALIFVK